MEMSNVTKQTIREILTEFGLVIKNKRNQLGYSQEELAYRSGLHRTYVTDIERGTRNVSLDSMTKLARALDVSLTELFARIEIGKYEKLSFASKRMQTTNAVDILIVEDDAKHAELVEHALKKNGVNNSVQIVHTGEDAINVLFDSKKMNRSNFGASQKVILLDLTLPSMSGLEVLRLIRENEKTKDFPVVIITASRSDQEYKESIKLGITAYITKPLDFNEFASVIPKIGLSWLLVR